MSIKTAFIALTALVLVSGSTAYAQSWRDQGRGWAGQGYSYSQSDEARFDHAKGNIE
jgi:hypothetical protein